MSLLNAHSDCTASIGRPVCLLQRNGRPPRAPAIAPWLLILIPDDHPESCSSVSGRIIPDSRVQTNTRERALYSDFVYPVTAPESLIALASTIASAELSSAT